MRLFSGIMLEKDIREKIKSFIDRMKEVNARVKWVEKDNLHITLMFYGEVHGNGIDSIKEKLKAAANRDSFEVEFSGVGGFPDLDDPRVIWIDIKGGKEIVNIIEMVRNDKGRPREIIPHLTIGRVKGGRNKRELANMMKKEVDVNFGKMKIGSIQLIKSTLTSKGAIYEVIESYQFKN